MASLALVAHDLGFSAAGSDINMEILIRKSLEGKGIVIKSFDRDNVTPAQAIAKGSVSKEENPEVAAALKMKVLMHSYPDTVEEVIQQHISIGISSARGKTSITVLLPHALTEAASTSYLTGDGEDCGVKDSHFFIYEANEYRRHLLAYHPDC